MPHVGFDVGALEDCGVHSLGLKTLCSKKGGKKSLKLAMVGRKKR
jgi:hypothetical protein